MFDILTRQDVYLVSPYSAPKGEVSEGEIIAVTLTSRSARVSSTNFTCGDHFYEEVEDTKDSVWVVQVVPHAGHMFMQPKDWATLVDKVSHFGVRTGIFDCSLDNRFVFESDMGSNTFVFVFESI